MGRLVGKNLVITGATSGIGLASAKLFAAEGARLLLVARGQGRLDELGAELGKNAIVASAHVENEDDLRRLARLAKEELGKVHGLYLNAGTAPFAPLEALTAELFDSCMKTNVFGSMRLVQELVPLMPKHSAILLTGSGMHHRPLPNASLWAASTYAVCGMGKALAVELAPKHIRVNVVSHGPTDTPIYNQYGMPDAEVIAMKEGLARSTLAQRLARPEEIAELALTLLAERCGYINGVEIVCDGGWALASASSESLA